MYTHVRTGNQKNYQMSLLSANCAADMIQRKEKKNENKGKPQLGSFQMASAEASQPCVVKLSLAPCCSACEYDTMCRPSTPMYNAAQL